MNDFTPPYSPGTAPSGQTRRSVESVSSPMNGSKMQSERNGAVPMPVGNNAQRPFSAIQNEGTNMGTLAMARSPPKNKNTQHVPCKFFLQGQCQAGRMCPFSHDVESTTRPAPCKYFAKGGCKFGRKCALLHVAPDGTVVNRHPAFLSGGAYASGSQTSSGLYAQPPPPGLLSMQAQGLEQRTNGDGLSDHDNFQYGIRAAYDVPQFDMTYASPSPQYGSPPQNDRVATSPPQKGLSVLDAPLPNSFDSNGISWAARNGPLAASVPSRFDLESPPSSLPRKSQLGNTALRDLQKSAFGDRGMDNVLASMGSSPPSGTDEPLTFPKRPLHSSYLRSSRTMVSASLGTYLPTTSFEYSDGEDDGDAEREEDLLPASLRDLIPDNRTRKDSRTRIEEDTPAAFLAAQRRSISGHGTTQDSKVGSPHSSSPSRYSGVFTRTQSARDLFGHVGSPLRDSGFPSLSTPRLTSTNGELSPSISSPPRQASMSMLTQELQRTKLDAARSQAAGNCQSPSAPVRTASTGSSGGGRKSLDRGLSSTSIGQRIDEEQEVFDMDEEPKSAFSPNGLSFTNNPWTNNKTLATSPRDTERSFGAIGGHRASK